MDGLSEQSVRRHWECLTPTTLLHTSDGRPLAVLSTGTLNTDGGPDYANALIRLDGRLFRGDVEIHARDRDWYLHRHHLDPHYNKVVLHVIAAAAGRAPASARTAGKRTLPTLMLAPWGNSAFHSVLPPTLFACPAMCATQFASVSPASLRKRLETLGWIRMARRATIVHDRFHELLRETGGFSTDEVWDQLLYEGFLEGLGYTTNKRAFGALAQLLPLSLIKRYRLEDPESLKALVFGASGLLPSSRGLRERESREYVIRLRKRWKALRKTFRCPRMHEADWLFFRLRPANFPTARIAILGTLLPRFLESGMARRIVACFREPIFAPRELLDALRQFFAYVPDRYWSTHLHFRGDAPGPPVALGADRIDAIVFNTIIPLAIVHARLMHTPEQEKRARTLARAMSAPAQNRITRKVEAGVLQGAIRLDSALLHQGAIELWKRYCEERRCGECPFVPKPSPPMSPSPQ